MAVRIRRRHDSGWAWARPASIFECAGWRRRRRSQWRSSRSAASSASTTGQPGPPTRRTSGSAASAAVELGSDRRGLEARWHEDDVRPAMTRYASVRRRRRAAPPGLVRMRRGRERGFSTRSPLPCTSPAARLAQQRRQRGEHEVQPLCAVSRLTTPNSGADGFASSSPSPWRSAALLRSLPGQVGGRIARGGPLSPAIPDRAVDAVEDAADPPPPAADHAVQPAAELRAWRSACIGGASPW